MQLQKITKGGNLHFKLKDGRYASVCIDSGYVRVSMHRKLVGGYDDAQSARGSNGNIKMYQINPRELTTQFIKVHSELFRVGNFAITKKLVPYNTGEYGRDVYWKCESFTTTAYPNQLVKLMDMLTKFEDKNCTFVGL